MVPAIPYGVAPAAQLLPTYDGETISTDALLSDGIVLVYVIAPRCGVCTVVGSQLGEVRERVPAITQWVVLTDIEGMGDEELRQWAEDAGLGNNVLLDTDAQLATDWIGDARAYPYVFAFEDGALLWAEPGAAERVNKFLPMAEACLASSSPGESVLADREVRLATGELRQVRDIVREGVWIVTVESPQLDGGPQRRAHLTNCEATLSGSGIRRLCLVETAQGGRLGPEAGQTEGVVWGVVAGPLGPRVDWLPYSEVFVDGKPAYTEQREHSTREIVMATLRAS
jgi:hypothetical protein